MLCLFTCRHLLQRIGQTNESNFYNAKGDVVRGYDLHKGDVFEVSAEGFDGEPAEKATVTCENKKLKIG